MKTSALMEKKAEKAREKIRELLWTDADVDKVADVAIAGGLQAAEVDKIEEEVTEGKAAVERLSSFDLPVLKATADETAAARTKAEKAMQKAEDVFAAAASDEQAASLKLTAAKTAFEAIATRVASGDFPATNMPPIVATIVEARCHYSEYESATDRCNDLSREIVKLESRATALQQEAAKLKATKSSEQSADIGGRLIPLADDYAGHATTMRKQCEDAKQRVESLQAEATAARKKYDAAKALLPW